MSIRSIPTVATANAAGTRTAAASNNHACRPRGRKFNIKIHAAILAAALGALAPWLANAAADPTTAHQADSTVLAQFKTGDLIRFKADRVEGSLKFTELVGR